MRNKRIIIKGSRKKIENSAKLPLDRGGRRKYNHGILVI